MSSAEVLTGQALVQPEFVVPEEHRPRVSYDQNFDQSQIPVINVSALVGEDAAKAAAAVKQIGDACRQWGFFQVVGHNVSEDLLQRVKSISSQFFSLPLEDKREVQRTARNAFGYYDSELTKNVRDWKEVFDFTRKRNAQVPDDHPDNRTVDGWNNFPDKPAAFRSTLEEYYSEVNKLAYSLLSAISLSLGLQSDYFHPHFTQHTSMCRLNFFPVCPDPSLVLGISRHRDQGALTVLVQDDVGGLQVKRHRDGVWVDVKPTPGAFVINLGDIFQVWSNEIYRSAEHRVVANSNKPRFSFPFFFNPSHDTVYAPVPSLVKPGEQPKYRPISYAEFSRKRNEGNFADYGEEVQIDHYRVA